MLGRTFLIKISFLISSSFVERETTFLVFYSTMNGEYEKYSFPFLVCAELAKRSYFDIGNSDDNERESEEHKESYIFTRTKAENCAIIKAVILVSKMKVNIDTLKLYCKLCIHCMHAWDIHTCMLILLEFQYDYFVNMVIPKLNLSDMR